MEIVHPGDKIFLLFISCNVIIFNSNSDTSKFQAIHKEISNSN